MGERPKQVDDHKTCLKLLVKSQNHFLKENVSNSPPKGKAKVLKPTTIAQAIQRWEESNERKIEEAKEVGFQFQIPPIEVMDRDLSLLKNVVKLSLSTNRIDKVANLNGLKYLRQLSLARNRLVSIRGIEVVKDTLERLYLSYNAIKSLAGIENLVKLNCLFMMYNELEMPEINRVVKLDSQFKELAFWGNPACGKATEIEWKDIMVTKFPTCRYLEGESRIEIRPSEIKKIAGDRPIEPEFTKEELIELDQVLTIYGIPSLEGGGDAEEDEE